MEEVNKYIKLTFRLANNQQFYISMGYDKEKSDQDNCDAILKHLIGLVEQEKILVVMQNAGDKQVPAIVNTRSMPYVTIEDISVYEQKLS